MQRSNSKNLAKLYTEHHWTLSDAAAHNKLSNIDVNQPDHSKGLSSNDAQKIYEENGPNRLPTAKEIGDLQLFLHQFLNKLWVLLCGAATLSLFGFIFDEKKDYATLAVSLILYVMIVVMCYISFLQEREARRVVRGFEHLLPQQCNVIRDGNETTISAEDLVVGDIVRVKAGIRVPADARLLTCSELRIESSSITGESEPVEYHADAVNESVSIFDARNVAFNGSMCVDGDGLAVVVKTGCNTIIGHIAAMTTGQPEKKSRLESQIKIFVTFLTVLALSVGGIVFVVGGIIQHWVNITLLLVTAFTVCAVAIIPEGMPATVTSILTLVARRLAHKNVYLKRLDIVEALGSANIIASDKTGTLTKNEMTVTDVWYSNEYVTEIPENKLAGNQKTMTVKTISKVASPLSDLLIAMTVCNTASFDESSQVKNTSKRLKATTIDMPSVEEEPARKPNMPLSLLLNRKANNDTITNHTITQNTVQRRRRRIQQFIQGMHAVGAPSEVALIKYAEQLINVHEFRRRFQIIFEIPFNSKRKFHLVIVRMREIGKSQCQYLMMTKGAPEIIISKCTRIMVNADDSSNANECELDDKRIEEFQKAYQTYGEHGRRVIGFAHKYFTADNKEEFNAEDPNIVSDLVFLGVCAIMDPPRDETKNAIRQCKEAGIKVFMVTGDHHITATAIAKQIGLIGNYTETGEPDWDIVNGEDILKLTASDWDKLVEKNSLVFARMTPEHKYIIVKECQQRNKIISMTGDGVNDAPALKASDIGVGMGSGSDVAKQASDIVLVDDNFSSMVGAVEEGRLMFDNIKKMLLYVLTHSVPELWALLIYYGFGMPIGITTLMILAIDLGTEIPPGIALCKEPMEGDIMQVPPRKEGEILIGKPILAYCYIYTGHTHALGCFLSYCTVFWIKGLNVRDLFMSNDRWLSTDNPIFSSNGIDLDLEEQLMISRQAASAWMVGIVFGQVFHIFSCRTLRQSIFTHGLLSNMSMNVAIVIEIVLLIIFVYTPGLNTFMGGAPVHPICWLVVAVCGLFVLAYNEGRKYAIRNWPTNKVVQWFKI